MLTKLNHGCYLSSSNGGAWHSDDAAVNNQAKGFKWGIGDTLEIEKNAETISIKKGNSED